MSELEELTDYFARRIMDVEISHEYAGFRAIMEGLNATKIPIQILGRLYGRLPGLAINNFMLLNLHVLQHWTLEDYQALITLTCGNGVAMYDLDHFLMVEGGLDYETRAKLWSGRYANISRHYHAFTFSGDGIVQHTDDQSLNARLHEKYLSIRPDDLRKFQSDLRRNIANAQMS